MENLAEKIIAQGKKTGFNLVGIIDAEKVHDYYGERLEALAQQGCLSPFLGNLKEERVNPGLLLANARSIIMVGLAYQEKKRVKPTGYYGRLAGSAQGKDYHQVIYAMLDQFAPAVKEIIGHEFNYTAFVDNKPVLEKALAVKAGFGSYGKNSLLINPELGSYFFLGGMITDIALSMILTEQVDTIKLGEIAELCNGCDKCITTCPTQAIIGPGVIDTRKCLAQISQNKGIVSSDYRKKLNNTLYGCDICQQVCPYNQKEAALWISEEREEEDGGWYDLIQLLDMDKASFNDTLGKTAAGWRGKTVLQRNAIIALGNSGDQQVIPVLVRALDDQRPVIRIHAAWALKQLGGDRVRDLLEKARKKEKVPQVREELNFV
ncbi:MAG: tRNA epoxyqueuosine(34) reductase QueG [Clostridia bacterium]|nr:tRNA epoxyqueuosine(34) reductase QueG [Clostridia bacterium]